MYTNIILLNLFRNFKNEIEKKINKKLNIFEPLKYFKESNNYNVTIEINDDVFINANFIKSNNNFYLKNVNTLNTIEYIKTNLK